MSAREVNSHPSVRAGRLLQTSKNKFPVNFCSAFNSTERFCSCCVIVKSPSVRCKNSFSQSSTGANLAVNHGINSFIASCSTCCAWANAFTATPKIVGRRYPILRHRPTSSLLQRRQKSVWQRFGARCAKVNIEPGRVACAPSARCRAPDWPRGHSTVEPSAFADNPTDKKYPSHYETGYQCCYQHKTSNGKPGVARLRGRTTPGLAPRLGKSGCVRSRTAQGAGYVAWPVRLRWASHFKYAWTFEKPFFFASSRKCFASSVG